jgi:hypothetical protein
MLARAAAGVSVRAAVRPTACFTCTASIRGSRALASGDQLVVAARHHDRHAEGAGEHGVEAELAVRLAVQAQVEPDRSEVGVVEDRRGRSGAGVVAEQEGGIEAVAHAVHHVERLGAAGQQFDAIVELLDQQVRVGAVPVVDEHLGGAGVERRPHGGVDLRRHQPPGALVLGAAAGHRLLGGDDAGHPFDVARDVDPHAHHLHERWWKPTALAAPGRRRA